MKPVGRFAISFAFLLLIGPDVTNGQSTNEAQKELTLLQSQWATARINHDVAFLDKFYAKDLQLNIMDGSVLARKDDIALFASGVIKPEVIEDRDLEIKVYGNTAVVTGIELLKGTYGGSPGDMDLRFLNVFTRLDNHWQLVAHQSTAVKRK